MQDPSRATGTERAERWFSGGGRMGELVLAKNWSETPLGPISSWPQSLRTTVSLCLASNFPISIAWGPQRILIYNDGYWPVCGAKHPHSMGQDFKECWFSAWPAIGDAFEQATAGQAAFLVNQRMFLDRNGYLEETFFTFSFSPIRDDTGRVGGILNPMTELTQQTLAERRLQVLRDLADRTGDAKSMADASRLVVSTLAAHELDLPFVLLYLLESDTRARLVAATGFEPGAPMSPSVVDFDAASVWPIAEAARSGQILEMSGIGRSGEEPSCRPYPEPPRAAFLMPLSFGGLNRPLGVLVAGVSARRALDEPYRTFYSLLRESVTTALGNARAYEAERKRAEALAEIDRAKTAFFSNVSHEFRTPLTLMLGPLEQVLGNEPGSLGAEARRQLEVVYGNAHRLQKLVNNLLDFSRIEAGRIEASYEPVDLSAFTADLASVFRSAIERAGLAFRVDCPSLPEPMYIDRDMWEKVVLNLLSNALKFTFEGEIAVSLAWEGDRAELTVRDTGIGIAPADLPHVFERFHRVRGARARTHEGTGIGLSLVQELVRLHGGTVQVESEVDRGTRFRISLPCGREHLPSDRVQVARTLSPTSVGNIAYVNEAIGWLSYENADRDVPPQDAVLSTTLPDRGSSLAQDRERIVLADDNTDMRGYLKRLLSRKWEVEAYADGAAAWRAIQGNRPSLVLADVMMPGLDGFELLHKVRDDDRTRDLPVILLSARAGEEARVEGMEAGADDYLTKPFSARELLARVGALLEIARARQEGARSLRESEERFRLLANSAPVLIWLNDESNRCEFMNQEYVEFLGSTMEELLGGGWRESLHPQDAESYFGAFEKAAERRERFEAEFRFRRADGEYRWMRTIGVPRFAGGAYEGYIGSTFDVHERKLAEESLQKSEAELRHASQMKDEFLATLSHELRTPLGAMLGWSQMLRTGRLNADLQARAFDALERNARAQKQLVDDLLDMSRIVSGRLPIRRETVDLAAVIGGAVDTVSPAAAEKGVPLEVRVVTDAPLLVDGDADRLRQVVWNLLTNAVKFTPPGGRVAVDLGKGDSRAEIVVRDTGEGIDESFLPFVFDRFRQADGRTTRTHGGIGLGLAIVRYLTEAHGGTVTAESAGPNRGARFTVLLPLAEEVPRFRKMPSSTETPPRRKLKGRRILAVDDEADARELLRVALEMDGADVTLASSAREALKALERKRFDVLLADIGMPDRDGFWLIRAVRECRGASGQVPAIAVTAYASLRERERVLAAGFDDHLAKPYEPDQLAAAVAGLTRRPRSRAKARG